MRGTFFSLFSQKFRLFFVLHCFRIEHKSHGFTVRATYRTNYVSIAMCLLFHFQDEVLAISERVVIRADDLLNWCDDTINWTYGLRANTLLDPSIKAETIAHHISHNSTECHDDVKIDEITSTNIRSLKNSKLDFDEVEKEKGKFNNKKKLH